MSETNIQLADYHILQNGEALAPSPGKLYCYTLAGNGVLIRARREGLDACARVAACGIRGLTPVEPFVEFSLPKVPAILTAIMLRKSREACVTNGAPVEALFYLEQQKGVWVLNVPEQRATSSSVRPENDADESYARSVIELHSHHQMDAFFSHQDDTDETGFKIYAVMGRIFSDPAEIRVRVGVYEHFVEVPASDIFELPAGLAEARR